MKRKDEEIAKACLEQWLSVQIPNEKQTWTEVTQADEPPDWYLEISGVNYAVEATSIVDFALNDGMKKTSIDIGFGVKGFVNQVEEEARSKGILNGTYLVTLVPMKNFENIRNELKDTFLSYIAETKDDRISEVKDLGKISGSNISIQKVNVESNSIEWLNFLGTKDSSEASKMLIESMGYALNQKAHKLSHLGYPIILLLLDSFEYSFMSNWSEAFRQLSIPSSFHTICRCRVDRPAAILFTREKSWIKS